LIDILKGLKMVISPIKRTLLSMIAILLVIVAGFSSYSCGCEEDKGISGDIAVPIRIQNANNIGSIEILLTYDSEVLEVTGVIAGELAQDSMLEYNIQNTDEVNIGIIDTDGISGEGILATIGFNVIDKVGTSYLTLESVRTHDVTTLIDVINNTTNGIFIAEDNDLEAPVISFTN
jgi:hypothetical protein